MIVSRLAAWTLISGLFAGAAAGAPLGDTDCKKTTVTNTEWTTYELHIWPLGKVAQLTICSDSDTTTTNYGTSESSEKPPPHPLAGSGELNRAARRYRVLAGKADCYGDLQVPNFDTTPLGAFLVGLDGSVVPVNIQQTTGSLEFFLGPNFDPAPYDPSFLASTWPGVELFARTSMFLQPSLTWLVGGANSDPTVVALMDLGAPDHKVLEGDLGVVAANAVVTAMVSATDAPFGNLMQIDGLTVPIVEDSTTAQFLSDFPQLTQVADSRGRVEIPFPQLTREGLDSTELYIALVARDPDTGVAVAVSTRAWVRLRDLSACD